MATKSRIAGAVLAGAVLWAVLWVGGAAIAQNIWSGILAPGQPVTHTGALLGYIAYSVLVSVASGYVTARIARGHLRAVHILAGIQLALGIAIEGAGWNLTPAWYHITFLVLLVPAIVFGGRMAADTRIQPALASSR
jgi:hypothetical protein